MQADQVDVSELHGEAAGEQLAGRAERQRRRFDHDQILGVDDSSEVDGEIDGACRRDEQDRVGGWLHG